MGELDIGPRTIATYADGRLAGQVVPLLRSGALWTVPWIGEAFEPVLRERLVAALDEVPGWVDEVEAGPLAVAHATRAPQPAPHGRLRGHRRDRLRLLGPISWFCLGLVEATSG